MNAEYGSGSASGNPTDWELAERPTELAHLDILLEAMYSHLECLPKNNENASSCCKARWTY
jgi:hypothetical protein